LLLRLPESNAAQYGSENQQKNAFSISFHKACPLTEC
jgi:hypothetical protein